MLKTCPKYYRSLLPVKNPGGVKAFGEHLRRLREQRGMSQVELADYANVSNVTVHRIETAQFAATIDVLLSLTKALQIPLHELVKVPGMEEAD
ncbi:XRE family transcriptional regulator [Hymenobacter gummosus]|uniref:XRE family transcriptional regulator n=1 Tax=Hymenobacter gummosus TaxID=1776032 RepID=A0A431U8I2_9BACT|nr:XRE family transcriptional regulator [Hymenobacter gummosus]